MNQIYTSDLLSFQKRLAPTVDSDVVIDRPKTEILPEPYVITHERKIRFKLYYPNARKVEMWDYLKEYKLEKMEIIGAENLIWGKDSLLYFSKLMAQVFYQSFSDRIWRKQSDKLYRRS